MRILLLAVLLFITIHFVRLDLAEGTIPMASFNNDLKQCNEEYEIITITIKTVEGDTIESLFALYPESEISFIERLASFYSLNPHLQNQGIIGNEQIILPLSRKQQNLCNESGR